MSKRTEHPVISRNRARRLEEFPAALQRFDETAIIVNSYFGNFSEFFDILLPLRSAQIRHTIGAKAGDDIAGPIRFMNS